MSGALVFHENKKIHGSADTEDSEDRFSSEIFQACTFVGIMTYNST